MIIGRLIPARLNIPELLELEKEPIPELGEGLPMAGGMDDGQDFFDSFGFTNGFSDN